MFGCWDSVDRSSVVLVGERAGLVAGTVADCWEIAVAGEEAGIDYCCFPAAEAVLR